MKYKLRVSGEVWEPMSLDQISRAAGRGEYDHTAEYWSEQLGAWRPVVGLMCDESAGSTLKDKRDAAVEWVEWLDSGSDDDCAICSHLAGKVFPLDAAPALPPPGCECLPWCRSILIAAESPAGEVATKATTTTSQSKADDNTGYLMIGVVVFILIAGLAFLVLSGCGQQRDRERNEPVEAGRPGTYGTARAKAIIAGIEGMEEVEWVRWEGNTIYVGFLLRPDDAQILANAWAPQLNAAWNFGAHVWIMPSRDDPRRSRFKHWAQATARHGQLE